MRFTLPQTGRTAGQLEDHQTWEGRGKAGQTAASCWVPLPLQVVGVAAIVAAIGGLLGNRLLTSGEPVCDYQEFTVPDGQVVRRSPPCTLPRERPTPLADPGRVKRSLRAGETYVVRVKGGFTGPATYVEYRGNERAVRLAHAFETIQHRTIESNDSQRIVELRHFERVWAVTLLSDAEEPALDLGPPGEPLLDAFRGCEPHVGMRRVAPKAVAEAILRNPDRAVAANATTAALWESDSLSGKTVRITYVDGVGVESIEPVGCTLAAVDGGFLFRLPVLWQGHLLAGKRNPNGTWTVDATQLRGLTPPSLREIPGGKIVIERTRDYRQGGTQRAKLRIRRPPSGRPAEYPFSPVGTFQYDLGESRITAATLRWRAPRDCLTALFPPTEPAFSHLVLETEPTIALHYCCKIRPPELPGKSCRQQGPEHGTASGGGQPASERWALGPGKWASIVPWDQQPFARAARGDIVAGMAILLSLSVVLFRWGATTARQRPAALSLGVASATVACILVFASTVHGTLRLAEILPLTNVILLGNWLPLGAMLLAGIVSGQQAVPRWRRAVFALILISLAWYTVLDDFLPQPVPSRGRYENGICLQTSSASCSPCCAVTALERCDIEASEREMSRLCLTSRAGTSPLGLYRGLKLKTRDTARDVEIVRCSVEELCRADSYPVIMNPRIEPETCIGRRDGAEPTRLPKVKHTVVILGVSPCGRVLIGDPCCGYVEWSLDDLRRRWSGVGLRLVERAGSVLKRPT